MPCLPSHTLTSPPSSHTLSHTEKPAYEFQEPAMPHTRAARAAGFYTADLFVDVARLSEHSVEYGRQLELVIDNYERRFLAPADLEYDEQVPDSMW